MSRTFEQELFAADLSQSERIKRFLQCLTARADVRVFLKAAPIQDGLVIGIASGWCREETALLDRIITARASQLSVEPLYVFDFTQIGSAQGLEELIPGIRPVFQSPILAIFDKGAVLKASSGDEATKMMEALATLG